MTDSIHCPIPGCPHPVPYITRHNPHALYYIVEHLENDIDAWIAIEYNCIINRLGASRVIFTNLTDAAVRDLETFDCYIGKAGVQYYADSITVLRQQHDRFKSLHNDNIVLTDMRTDTELHPTTSAAIQYIIVGGILGDNPPRDRAGFIRDSKMFGLRHLGPKQMSADTAAFACTLVLDHQHQLSDLQYVDDPEIDLTDGDTSVQVAPGEDDDGGGSDKMFGESVMLPFRYVCDPATQQPMFPVGLRELLMKDADFSLTDMEEVDGALSEDINGLQDSLQEETIK